MAAGPAVRSGDFPAPGVLGTTRELLELRLNDASFLKRLYLMVTNTEELPAIPDPANRIIFKPAKQVWQATCRF